jgi:hypothetical protein
MRKRSHNHVRLVIAAGSLLAALGALIFAGLRPTAMAVAAATPAPVTLGAAVVSPASGSAAPTQTIQLGVFSLTNNSSSTAAAVNSVTLTFSNPGLFSSTTLSAVGASPSTAAPPAASNVYNFQIPAVIQPGQTLAFSLTVTLANTTAANTLGGVAYAGVTAMPEPVGGAQPLWIALGAIGIAMLALPADGRRRVWLLAAVSLLLAAGAPGCGGTTGGGSDQPTGSSSQSVTAVSAMTVPNGVVTKPSPVPVFGLPLDLGSITRT